jgi:hypothetical protein
MVRFTLLLPATCFGFLYFSQLQVEVLFTEEGNIKKLVFCKMQ